MKEIKSYPEYEAEFRKAMKEYSSLSDKETDAFSNLLIERNYVKRQFLDDRAATELLGSNQMNPRAFASCACDLDPEDFPTKQKIDENETVFSGTMNFTGVRQQKK